MRVLAIGRGAPWSGPRSGLPIRRSALLRGAARAGDLDYVMLSPTNADAASAPPEVRAVVHVPTTPRHTGARGHVEWYASATVRSDAPPYELTRASLTDAGRARVTVERLCAEHDVVWLLDKHSAFLVGSAARASPAPVILDVEELVADRIRQEASVLRSTPDGGVRARVRNAARAASLERTARAWDRWMPRLASLASVCTVSNPRDVGRLGVSRGAVLPNGCVVPPRRDARSPGAGPPVLLFHGLMSYGPNTDGAEHLVRHVVPELARAIGDDFEVRIVGRAPAAVHALARVDPRVTVTGYVEDIEHEVRAADAVVVPLRVGSGTRLKILEAMALCTPVVSTTVGCDGLDVRDGEHLLVADEPTNFASACARVVGDTTLRTRLVVSAYDVARSYDWRGIEADVEALTREPVAAS